MTNQEALRTATTLLIRLDNAQRRIEGPRRENTKIVAGIETREVDALKRIMALYRHQAKIIESQAGEIQQLKERAACLEADKAQGSLF